MTITDTHSTRSSKRCPPRSVMVPMIRSAAVVDELLQPKEESMMDSITENEAVNQNGAPSATHDHNAPRSNKVICFYWQWGYCKYDSQCRYQHPLNEFNTVRRPVPEPIAESFYDFSVERRAQMRIQTLEHEVQQLKKDLSSQRETVAMAQTVLVNIGASVAAAAAATSASSSMVFIPPHEFQPFPQRPIVQPNHRQRRQRRGAAPAEHDFTTQPANGLVADGQPRPVFFPSSLPFQRFSVSAHAVAPQTDFNGNRRGNKRKPVSPLAIDGHEKEPEILHDHPNADPSQSDSSIIGLEARRSGKRKGRRGARR